MTDGAGKKRAAFGLTLLALAIQTVTAGVSQPVLVDCGGQGMHWATIFTNTVLLAWEWPAGATHAALWAEGMNGTFSTNFTEGASNVLWRVFTSDAPEKEDVYDLSLTFYDDGNETVGMLTSRLAVVSGAFQAATVDAYTDGDVWSKVKQNVVIPFRAFFAEAATNAVTARLVIAKRGGATQTNGFPTAAGYYGWKIRNGGWGYGTFDFSLSFPETGADVLLAELFRPMDGTAVSVR